MVKLRWLGLLAIMAFICGCESSDEAPGGYWNTKDGGASSGNTSAEAAKGGETASTSGSSGSSGAAFSLGSVHWLHANVGGWAETAHLSVHISGGTINLNYNKSNVWPARNGANANPWVFVNRDGKWYGATFEWLRPGQTAKPTSTVRGDHIKKPPLNNFKPVSGEVYGFMVSGLARDKTRNVSERSNVVMVRWP